MRVPEDEVAGSGDPRLATYRRIIVDDPPYGIHTPLQEIRDYVTGRYAGGSGALLSGKQLRKTTARPEALTEHCGIFR
jgi:hypothetical protein